MRIKNAKDTRKPKQSNLDEEDEGEEGKFSGEFSQCLILKLNNHSLRYIKIHIKKRKRKSDEDQESFIVFQEIL